MPEGRHKNGAVTLLQTGFFYFDDTRTNGCERVSGNKQNVEDIS